jgi:hypothetical protein
MNTFPDVRYLEDRTNRRPHARARRIDLGHGR